MLGFVASLAYYTAYYSLSRRPTRSDGLVIVSQTPLFIHCYPEGGGTRPIFGYRFETQMLSRFQTLTLFKTKKKS